MANQTEDVRIDQYLDRICPANRDSTWSGKLAERAGWMFGIRISAAEIEASSDSAMRAMQQFYYLEFKALHDDMKAHLLARIDSYEAEGLSRSEAVDAAIRRFGNPFILKLRVEFVRSRQFACQFFERPGFSPNPAFSAVANRFLLALISTIVALPTLAGLQYNPHSEAFVQSGLRSDIRYVLASIELSIVNLAYLSMVSAQLGAVWPAIKKPMHEASILQHIVRLTSIVCRYVALMWAPALLLELDSYMFSSQSVVTATLLTAIQLFGCVVAYTLWQNLGRTSQTAAD